jgi:hypothetical protein
MRKVSTAEPGVLTAITGILKIKNPAAVTAGLE